MRVTLVNSSDGGGGPGRAMYRIHQGLHELDIDSTMIVREKNTKDENVVGLDQRFPSATFGRLWHIVRKKLDSLPNFVYRSRSDVTFHPNVLPGKQLYKAIEKANPDIIQLSWISGGLLKIEDITDFNKPIVWRLPDMWALTGGCHFTRGCDKYQAKCGCCPALGSNSSQDLSRWVWNRKADSYNNIDLTFVATSEWMKNRIESATLAKNHNVVKIPNGLDLTTFQPVDQAEARRIYGLPENKQIILFGAVNPESERKGFNLLNEAINNLTVEYERSDIELAVFGNYSGNISLPFDVNQIGYLYDEESLALLYSAADVMVVPSREEPFGQTVTESLACGTPVVAFNATGPKDLINHKDSGYLAEPFDPKDLSRGITWILSHNRYEGLSENARESAVQRFDIKSISEQYLDLYNQIFSN